MTEQIGTRTTPLNPGDDLTGKLIFTFLANAMVDDTYDAQELIDFIRTGLTAAGLTQDEVDGRIDVILDAAIPQNRRIPPFGAGDANQVLTVADDGNSIGFEPAAAGATGPAGPQGPAGPTGPAGPAGSGGLTQSQVDARIESWARAGNTDDIPFPKIDDSLFGTISVKADTDQQATIVINANAANARIQAIGAAFSITSDEAADADSMIEIDFDASFVGSTLPASLSLQLWTSGLSTNRAIDTVDIDLSGAGLNKQGSHAFKIDSSVTSYVFELYGAGGSAQSNGTFTISNIQVRRSDGNAGHNIRQLALEVVSEWARRGNAALIPKGKMPDDVAYQADIPHIPATAYQRLNDAAPGVTLTATNQDSVHAAAATLFSPSLDLDTHAHGELHLSLEVSVAPVSDVNMGFSEGGTNQTDDDRSRALSAVIFASDIAGQTAIQTGAIGTEPNGVSAFRIGLWSASTILGYYEIYITRDADNQVGWYAFYDSEGSGATGATITATLRASFSQGGDAAIRNSRGRLLATSSVMSTTRQDDNSEYASVRWTLESNAGLTIANNKLIKPTFRTQPNQTGYWFVVEVDGTEVSETPVNFHSGQGNRVAILPAVNPMVRSGQSIELARFPGSSGVEYILEGEAPGTLPTNTIIKVYMAVI